MSLEDATFQTCKRCSAAALVVQLVSFIYMRLLCWIVKALQVISRLFNSSLTVAQTKKYVQVHLTLAARILDYLDKRNAENGCASADMNSDLFNKRLLLTPNLWFTLYNNVLFYGRIIRDWFCMQIIKSSN